MEKKFILVCIPLVMSLSCATLSKTAPKRAQEPVVLEKIHFSVAAWKLGEDQRPLLQKNAEILKKQEESQVMIRGHTDTSGSEAYNLYLGDRRARVVKSELQKLGVDPRRLIVISHGESQPLATDGSVQGMAINRRVELSFRVLEE